MKQRQRAEDHVVGPDGQHPDHHLDIARQVGVSELGPFRRAGGARRVQDHGRVIARAIDDLGGRLGARQQSLKLAGRHDLAFRSRQIRPALRGLGEVMPCENELGVGVAQVKSDLSLLEQHVHGHNHAPCAQYAVVSERKIRNVRQHYPDSVARLHAQLEEQAGDPSGRLVQLRVGHHILVEPQRRPLPVRSCRARQLQRQVVAHPSSSIRKLNPAADIFLRQPGSGNCGRTHSASQGSPDL